MCIDVETSGFDPFTCHIVGVSLAGSVEKAVYVPLRHSYLGVSPDEQIRPEDFFRFLDANLAGRLIIGHNLKFDLAFLQREGVKVGSDIFDTMIAAYVVDPGRANALKKLGQDILGYEVKEYHDVAKNGSFAQVDLASAADYACQDVLLTMRLYPRLKQELHERKLLRLFEELEMPLLPIIMGMEQIGIGLNADYLRVLTRELGERLAELEASIHQHPGEYSTSIQPSSCRKCFFAICSLNRQRKPRPAIQLTARFCVFLLLCILLVGIYSNTANWQNSNLLMLNHCLRSSIL